MFEKLKSTKDYYQELEKKLADPNILADMDRWKELNIEYAGLKPLVDKYSEYEKKLNTIKEDKEMIEVTDDHDMVEMLKIGRASCRERV